MSTRLIPFKEIISTEELNLLDNLTIEKRSYEEFLAFLTNKNIENENYITIWKQYLIVLERWKQLINTVSENLILKFSVKETDYFNIDYENQLIIVNIT